MSRKIFIQCMVFTSIFLVSGCSLSKKDITQKESTISAPILLEQKHAETSEKNFAENAEENEDLSDKKIAYITVDDGPSRNNTVAILDTLKKYTVKATFFVLPHDNMDDIYNRILNEGHVIGNHSYSHANYLYASTEEFERDLLKAKGFIYNKLNYTTTVFRFPGGTMGRKKSSIEKRSDILKKNGYQYFDWDVSVADTDPNLKNYGDEQFIINLMIKNVVNNTKEKKRLIVLMHDDFTKTYTSKALPFIIEGLKEQGYIFDVLTNYKK